MALNVGVITGGTDDIRVTSGGSVLNPDMFSVFDGNFGFTMTEYTAATINQTQMNGEDVLVLCEIVNSSTTLRDMIITSGNPVVILFSNETTDEAYNSATIGNLLGLVANEQRHVDPGNSTLATRSSWTIPNTAAARGNRITSGFATPHTFQPWEFDSTSASFSDYSRLASTTTSYAGSILVNDPDGLPVMIAAESGDARGAWVGGTFGANMVWFGGWNNGPSSASYPTADFNTLFQLAIRWAGGEIPDGTFI